MKMNFKSLMVLALAAGTIATTSCSKEGCTDETAINYDADAKDDDGSCQFASNNITENTTWESGSVIDLNGRVFVTDGATLTIEPGVIVKAAAGSGANASVLIVARGSKIMAEGTATEPIIFTTAADQIQPGQIESPNLASTVNGQWGGLIILGKANGSFKGDVSEVSIEGIPATDVNGKYGGNDDNDNSGVLSYVSIRHGGASIGEGNEINGLTLGCVGKGTRIENIEVVGNQDDGIEWFGGTVDVSNAVVLNAGDDALDTDQAFNGTVTNFVVINAGDKAFELDGPEGSYLNGAHTFTNGTVYAQGASGLIDFDANSNVNMSQIFFTDLMDGQDVDNYEVTFEDDGVTVADEGYVNNPNGFGISSFQAIIPAGFTKADFFVDGSADQVTEVTVGTVGADMTAFAGWSLSAVSGEMN